jgi:hypothetical protein
MTVVLIQFPDLDSAPVGCWWSDPDAAFPYDYYPNPTPLRAIILARLSLKVPDVPWENYFAQIADGGSVAPDYETIEIPDDSTPQQVFDRLAHIAS